MLVLSPVFISSCPGKELGQQGAFSLAEAGANVVIFPDLNEEITKQSSGESRSYTSNKEYTATFSRVDDTDTQGVQEMVVSVVNKFGRLDYCMNRSGVSKPALRLLWLFRPCFLFLSNPDRALANHTCSCSLGDTHVHCPVAETDIENFDRLLNNNAKGMTMCLRAQCAAIRKNTQRQAHGRQRSA